MSVTFGEASDKLAREAKRTADLLVSPYNDDLIQTICRETRQLHVRAESFLRAMRNNNNNTDSQTTPPHLPSQLTEIMLHHLTIKRNKRVLFAYHQQRMEKLKELSWDVGRRSTNQREIKASMSASEQKFINEYGEMVNAYKQSFLDVDVGGNGGTGLDPPLDLYIEVRVLRDAGRINTEFGELNLIKGNQEFVRRSDVESLINAGYLKHIT